MPATVNLALNLAPSSHSVDAQILKMSSAAEDFSFEDAFSQQNTESNRPEEPKRKAEARSDSADKAPVKPDQRSDRAEVREARADKSETVENKPVESEATDDTAEEVSSSGADTGDQDAEPKSDAEPESQETAVTVDSESSEEGNLLPMGFSNWLNTPLTGQVLQGEGESLSLANVTTSPLATVTVTPLGTDTELGDIEAGSALEDGHILGLAPQQLVMPLGAVQEVSAQATSLSQAGLLPSNGLLQPTQLGVQQGAQPLAQSLMGLEGGELSELMKTMDPELALMNADKALVKVGSSSTASSTLTAVQSVLNSTGAGRSVFEARPAVQTAVNIPVSDTTPWTKAVTERVAWLAGQRVQSADIRLDPPELGAMQIKIQVNHEQQASIHFTVQHGVVKEALEQTAARLRETLAEQGLDLVEVNVSTQSEQNGREAGDDAQSGQGSLFAGDGGDSEEELEALTPLNSNQGLVDHFV